MFTISFFLRKPKNWISGTRQVLYCRIFPYDIPITTHEKLLADQVKGKKIIKGEWDAEAEKVRSLHPSYLAINANLERIRLALDKYLRESDMNGGAITHEQLYAIVNPSRAKRKAEKKAPKVKVETIQEVYDSWVKSYKEKLNLGNTGEQKGDKYTRSYERVPFYLNEFRQGIAFSALNDKQVIEDFKRYMLTSTTIEDRTINKLLTGIRVLMDFKGLPKAHIEKLKNKSTTLYSLTWKEILQLRDAPYVKESERHAAHVFVITCQICLRYSDLYKPALNHLFEVRNGAKAFNLNQSKTGDDVYIPFPVMASGIMEQYNWKLPLSQTKSAKEGSRTLITNLKAAAKFAGLTRKVRITKVRGGHITEEWKPLHEVISIHDARHTGSTLVLEATGDTRLADALLGHANASPYMHNNPVLIANKLLDAWAKIEAEGNE